MFYIVFLMDANTLAKLFVAVVLIVAGKKIGGK